MVAWKSFGSLLFDFFVPQLLGISPDSSSKKIIAAKFSI